MTQLAPRTGEPPGASLAVLTTGLTKRFGDRTVVDGVGLAIPIMTQYDQLVDRDSRLSG